MEKMRMHLQAQRKPLRTIRIFEADEQDQVESITKGKYKAPATNMADASV
jgi:hypothetical protein